MCTGAIIECHKTEPCVVTCSGKWACQNAIIYAGNVDLTVTCHSDSERFVCNQLTIHAETASLFTLDGCNSSHSCAGITIYFPTESNNPSKIINADTSLGATLTREWPINFYAINGWADIQFIGYKETDRQGRDNQGIMHCGGTGMRYNITCNINQGRTTIGAERDWECDTKECVNATYLSPNMTMAPTPPPSYPPTSTPSQVTSHPTTGTSDPSLAPSAALSPAQSPDAPSFAPSPAPSVQPPSESPSEAPTTKERTYNTLAIQ